MKRFFSVLLCVLILSASAAAADSIDTSFADFKTLRELQDYIYSFSPRAIMNGWSLYALLSGTVADVYQVVENNNHWEMKVIVDEPEARTPFASDDPYFIAHFRLHVDPCPFAVGDQVTVYGSLNILYSNTFVPQITVDLINGSDDF